MRAFWRELGFRVISFLAWMMMDTLGRSTRFQVRGFEHVKTLRDSGRGFIMAIWHGRTMLPVHYCRGMGIWAITSLSDDGELQTRIVSRFGYRIIRGSTGRGGMRAALTAVKRLQEGGILAITPDGPKGPANVVQDGTVFLAKRAKCPIVPLGVGISRRRLMNAWDKYALPALFTKCAIIFGEPIYLSGDEENAETQPAELIKCELDRLQKEAQLMVMESK